MGRSTRAAEAKTKAFQEEAGFLASSDLEISKLASPEAGPSRRKSGRHAGPSNDVNEAATTAWSSEIVKPMSRPERGVVGLRTFVPLSDKERREHERQIALVAEEIDKEDEFKRFNVGWVLPAGSKRKGRADRPTESVSSRANSSPRKRSKAELPTPTLPESSTFPESAAMSRDEFGSSLSPPPEAEEEVENAPVIDIPPSSPPIVTAESIAPVVSAAPAPKRSRGRFSSGKKRKLETDDEETPRKVKKGKKAVIPVDGDTEMEVDGVHENKVVDDDQELTPVPNDGSPEASEKVEEDGDQLTPVPEDAGSTEMVEVVAPESAAKGKRKAGESKRKEPRFTPKAKKKIKEKEIPVEVEEEAEETIEETVDDPYLPGTLVWAKLSSFPYFPAEVIDPDDEESHVPTIVLDLGEEIRQAGSRVWLVRFFDKQASYGWMPRERLDMLGEVDAIDQMYLAGKERVRTKSFKTSSIRQACRKAYRDALAAMAGEGEEDAVATEVVEAE
ncbi:hypothetical protein P7C73_g5593, partial [Tremellales sp. Uapishka_1]